MKRNVRLLLAGLAAFAATPAMAVEPPPGPQSPAIQPEKDATAHYLVEPASETLTQLPADALAIDPQALGQAILNGEEYTFTITPSMLKADKKPNTSPMRKAAKATPKSLSAAQYVSIDQNVLNQTYAFGMQLATRATDQYGAPVQNGWTMTNVAGLGGTVFGTYDATAKTITFPAGQVIYEEYQIKFMKIRLNADGTVTVRKNEKIVATVNDDGSMTLPAWGAVAIDANNKATAYNLFSESRWVPANTTVKGLSSAKKQEVEYPCLLEQNTAGEVMCYNLTGYSDVIAARPLASRSLQMSPQYVTSSSLYGDFFIYPIDKETGKVLRTSNIIFDPTEGGFSCDGWALASHDPSSGNLIEAMQKVTLGTSALIEYPAAPARTFQGTGSETDPYVIKSFADLRNLAGLVEQGESFQGYHFILGNDIDLSTVEPGAYMPIGDDTHPFLGSFDGAGHKLSGLRLEGRGNMYVGIFGKIGTQGSVSNLNVESMGVQGSGDNIGGIAGYNEGTIHNCKVSNTQLFTQGAMTGGIAGCSSGSITDCSFMGNIQGLGSQGGIVGQAIGTISKCQVQANIRIIGFYTTRGRDCGGIAGVFSAGTISDCSVTGMVADTYGRGAIGGLVGRSLGDAVVQRSFNVASVSGKLLSGDGNYSYAGGLTGMLYGATYTDCYNAGSVMENEANPNAGGLFGNLSVTYTTSGGSTTMTNKSDVTNCFNAGYTRLATTDGIQGIVGSAFHLDGFPETPEDVCLHNVTYDRQVLPFGETKYGRNSSYFLGKLPEGYSSDVWETVTDGYPRLKVHASSPYSALASSAPKLREGQTAAKVKTGFEVTSAAPTVTWALFDSETSTYVQDTPVLKLSGNQATVKDQYGNAYIVARTDDGWGAKMYDFAVVPKLFEGEGTAENPYLLKTVADFVTLDNAITLHAQPHEGDFFAMTGDIDFKLGDEFNGFGCSQPYRRPFSGTFDGRGHYIRGLKLVSGFNPAAADLSQVKGYLGLFSLLGDSATVKNVNIGPDCSLDFYAYSGAVAGFNRGRIENCRNYAPITGYERQIGGIAGVSYGGTVTGCYNAGQITSHFGHAGGIVGINFTGALIEYCQNDADITATPHANPVKAASYNYTGGITGLNYGSVNHNVCQSVVTANEGVGGIIGYNINTSATTVAGNLFTGFLNCLKNVTTRGAIIGVYDYRYNCSANYFDASVNLNGGINNASLTGFIGLSSAEITSGNALESLPADMYSFAADSYPVLRAFADEPAAKALRSLYIGFGKGMLRTNINGTVPLSHPAGATWSLTGSDAFSISGNSLTAVKPTGMQLAKADISVTLGDYSKNYAVSSIPDILPGEGTAASPYIIATPADWNKLADFVEETKWEYTGSNFRLSGDIDFQGDSLHVLAHDGVRFDGVLDGNGKKITGFRYSNTNGFANRIQGPNFYVGKRIGLIGALGAGGEIRDLTLGGEFCSRGTSGGFTSDCYGKISNCTYEGTLTTDAGGNIGAFAYILFEGGSITDCVNKGTIICDGAFFSGIAYTVQANALVENCVNRGTLKAKDNKASFAFGIAGNVLGTIRGCSNEGKIEADGEVAGIAYKLGGGALLENCVNKSDIDVSATSSGAHGIFIESAAGSEHTVRGCSNEGNLKGKSNVFGICRDANEYIRIEDCHNSGTLTATTGVAAGIAKNLKGVATDANSTEGIGGTITRCYNSGTISSHQYLTAGIVCTVEAFASVSDCYNTADITVNEDSNSGLGCAGIAASVSGSLDRCFNTGNISASVSGTGGISGMVGSVGTKFLSTVSNCFNLGDVRLIGTKGNTYHGRAGGISGSTYNTQAHYINCYNAGNVYGDSRIGGIVGQVFATKPVIEKCYNSGRVILNPGVTAREASYTVYAKQDELDGKPFYENVKEVYYDRQVNPEAVLRHVPGSDKTTAEMAALDLGDAFQAPSFGGYPLLKAFGEDGKASGVSGAMLRLSKDTDTHMEVTLPVTLLAPEGCVWTSLQPDVLEISGNMATPKTTGDAELRCTDSDGNVRKFMVKVNPDFSGIDRMFAGKTVKSVTYIGTDGCATASPLPGEVYIVRTLFTDGTIHVAKKMIP